MRMRNAMIITVAALILLTYVTCAAQFIGGTGGAP